MTLRHRSFAALSNSPIDYRPKFTQHLVERYHHRPQRFFLQLRDAGVVTVYFQI